MQPSFSNSDATNKLIQHTTSLSAGQDYAKSGHASRYLYLRTAVLYSCLGVVQQMNGRDKNIVF